MTNLIPSIIISIVFLSNDDSLSCHERDFIIILCFKMMKSEQVLFPFLHHLERLEMPCDLKGTILEESDDIYRYDS